VVALLWVSMQLVAMVRRPPCEELLDVADRKVAELQRRMRDMEAALRRPAAVAASTPERLPAPTPADPPAADVVALRGRATASAQGLAALGAPGAGSGSCLPKSSRTEDDGYPDEYRGWFDVQGCGRCLDYCRWVGDSGSGGDPRERTAEADSWWSCRLAGTDAAKTPPGYFVTWKYALCSGEGALAPSQVADEQHPASLAKMGNPITEDQLKAAAANHAIGVVVLVCKRPMYLERTMRSLVAAERDLSKFPLVISQDAHDPAMTRLVRDEYVAKGVAYHINHEHEANAEQIAKTFGQVKHTLGYVRIAQHFGWVMRTMFDRFGFEAVIFIEEDMEVAPDFFSYFGATLPLLQKDKDLFCVSAWNDNGYGKMVLEPRRAYRTDFFPGLGWMMTKEMWAEVRDRWAVAYWDEFMRRPDVRKGRQCIRPDVSRSFTFGSQGTSSGQFFEQHLSKIKLNDIAVNWSTLDLSSISSVAAFDAFLTAEITAARKVSGPEEIGALGPGGDAVRVQYDDKSSYKSLAKRFSLMEDEKEGIRRMSYRGVIPFAWNGRRAYLYTEQWPPNLT